MKPVRAVAVSIWCVGVGVLVGLAQHYGGATLAAVVGLLAIGLSMWIGYVLDSNPALPPPPGGSSE